MAALSPSWWTLSGLIGVSRYHATIAGFSRKVALKLANSPACFVHRTHLSYPYIRLLPASSKLDFRSINSHSSTRLHSPSYNIVVKGIKRNPFLSSHICVNESYRLFGSSYEAQKRKVRERYLQNEVNEEELNSHDSTASSFTGQVIQNTSKHQHVNSTSRVGDSELQYSQFTNDDKVCTEANYEPKTSCQSFSSTVYNSNPLSNFVSNIDKNPMTDVKSKSECVNLTDTQAIQEESSKASVFDDPTVTTIHSCSTSKMDAAKVDSVDVKSLSESTNASNMVDNEKQPEKMGIFKRFHHTYKQYGKVLVVVHCATSTVWSALFYYTAMSGVDVEPLLRWLGAGDTIVSFYTMPGVGNAAVAYLFYKIATPVRYPVTIAGTHLAVRCLRKWGYMPPVSQENTLRSLVSEGLTQMKSKYQHYHDQFGDIRSEYKERIKKFDEWSPNKK